MSEENTTPVPPPSAPAYRVLLSVGDPSGDLHAGRVVAELKRRRSDVHLFGFGGPRMGEAGALITYDNRGCSAIGVLESLKLIPRLYRVLNGLRQVLHSSPPDLLVLVDYGAFNMRLAATAHEVGVPVLYYIPPGCRAAATMRCATYCH